MIRYLLDSSALWRILRDPALRAAWAEVVSAGAIGSCHPQRVEFRRSARTIDEYEQMSGMFEAPYPDAALPKGAWRWIESAQHPLLRQGAHPALSAVHLVVFHDDKDFAIAARYLGLGDALHPGAGPGHPLARSHR